MPTVSRAGVRAAAAVLVVGGGLAIAVTAAAGPARADSWESYTFVVNQGANTITGYAPGADGNIAPAVTISGPGTGLAEDNFIARDPHGNVWVTNFSNNSVTEYSPGANGNATPIATISGTATGLFNEDPHAVLPPLAAPDAPVIAAVTAGNEQASVSFARSANDGGSPVISSVVTAIDTTNPANGGQTAAGVASPITVTGLTGGDSYTFTVTASNIAGTGPASGPSSSVTPSGQTATVVASSTGGDSTYGQPVVFTATVSSSDGGGEAPTG